MRVAALYDIHANLAALDAVLEEVYRANADRIIVGGDVFPGPMPVETIERLLAIDLPIDFIRGNGDREVLAAMHGTETSTLPQQAREILRDNAQRLGRRYEATIASWPATLRLNIPGSGDVLFCHATPRSDTEIFSESTPEEQLLPILADAGAPIVICGHTHVQFDRMIGNTRVVNAGSVGMPFQEPGAYWLLIDAGIQLRRTL
jgi:predicted phosphodiesterase